LPYESYKAGRSGLSENGYEMKLGLPVFCLLHVIFFQFSHAAAQSQREDSIFYQLAFNHTVTVYYDQLGDQSRIFNGTKYPDFEYKFQKGSPFFLSENPLPGSVVYDSVYYPDLSVFFDDYRQYLVVVDQFFKLKLINEKVSSFQIGDHHFVRFPISKNNGLPYSGYYEVIYSGRSRVLKRIVKNYREQLSIPEGITRILDEQVHYFIKRGEIFEPVNSKRELLNFMNDHRKDVQKFIRKKGLSYHEDMENILIQAASYYDQLDNY
jgi:hypothetical protein